MGLFNFLEQTTYSFEGKKENERVVLFIHRHWFVVVSKLIFLTLITLSPLLIFSVFGQFIISNNLVPIFALFWSAIIMLSWILFFYSLTLYTLDTWLVTNMRIINSVQRGFFDRTVSELSISSIQDVSIKIDGVMATTLNFGHIEVQTASDAHHFTFEEVPAPQHVKDAIIAVVDEYKQTHLLKKTV